jgi:hypothetical protein
MKTQPLNDLEIGDKFVFKSAFKKRSPVWVVIGNTWGARMLLCESRQSGIWRWRSGKTEVIKITTVKAV